MRAWVSSRHGWRAFGLQPRAADRGAILIHFGHRSLVIGWD